MNDQPTSVLLYRASDALEAAMILNALDSAGIPYTSTEAQAAIALGEVPTDALQVDILVPSSFAANGRTVIEELQARRRSEREDGAGWTCPSCAEKNAGTFEVCWNCGTALV